MQKKLSITTFNKIFTLIFCLTAALIIGLAFFCVEDPKLDMLVNIEMYVDPPEREHRTNRQFFVNENIDVHIEAAFKEPIDSLAFGAIIDTGEHISKEDMKAVCDSIRTGTAIGLENRFSIRFDRPGKVLLVGVAWSEDDDDLDTLHIQIVANDTFYTVTYDGHDANGGDVPVDTAHYRQGATVKVSGNSGNLVNNGKTFVGWITDTAGGGRRYSPDGTFIMDTFPVTLYAAWTDSATYRVLYNGNGVTSGSVPEDRNNYLPGMTVTAAGPGALTREGFGFAEWNTAADGAGTSYTTDTTFIMKHAAVTLYAQWTDSSLFPVTYNGNGNSAGKPPIDNKTYKSGDTVIVKGNTGNMEKQGLALLGWSTRMENRDIIYVPGMILLMGDTALTLYAQWTSDPTLTVTYDGNGNTDGRVPAVPQKYIEGAMVTIFGNTGNIARTGHSFKGWNASKDGNGTPYPPGATFRMGTFDVTLYAVWETNQYMVVYDGNGKTEGNVPPQTNHRFGTQPTVATIGDMKRTGYTFFRWNTKKDGTGFDYEPGVDKITMGDANDTLYARWTANRYPVVYYGNGSTGGTPPAMAEGIFDSTITLADKGSLAKECYSFAGWDTVAGGGNGFLPGATFTISKADTNRLYAQWIIDSFTVTFDAREGSEVDSAWADCGDTVKTPQPPVRTGFTFAGWYGEEACTNPWVFKNVKITGNDTLYAKWSKNKYAIVYLGNGNTSGTSSLIDSVFFGDSVTVRGLGNLAKTGNSFDVWNAKQNGEGENRAPGFKYVKEAGNDTLWAQWNKNRYPVVYYGNGNTGGTVPETILYLYDTSVTIQKHGSLTKSCSSFVAWNTVANGSGTAFREDTVIKMPPDTLKFYAQWAVIPYTITFDKNDAGATGTMSPQNIACGATVNLTPNAYVKTGWAFAGWATGAGGTVVYVDKANYTTRTGNVVLYARWKTTINFNDQSATTPPSPANITVYAPAKTVGTLPSAPTKTGCNFAGWYMEVVGGGNEFTARSPVNADITVYAKWTVTDVDGNVYNTVTIGTQTWMVENLKTTKYNDGSAIPLVTNEAAWAALLTPGYSWYGNDIANKNLYGALYNWYVVDLANPKKVAPTGWHVPSDEEWTTLENYLIDNGYNYDGKTTGNNIAKSMAATTNWNTYSTEGTIGDDLTKNNKSGFSALPGGYRSINGTFDYVGDYGRWWSATAGTALSTWHRNLYYSSPFIGRGNDDEKVGRSVRCLRD